MVGILLGILVVDLDSVINLANPTSAGYTLRASMFPYFVNGIQVPVGPCFDSSPIFNESPNTIICTGYPFAYLT